MTKIYNLALGGTGLDGAAFVGALRQFNKSTNNNLKHIKRVVGSATGGILAMMIALGYTVDEMEKIFHEEFTMQKLENKNKKSSTTYDGDKLETLIGRIIETKTHNLDFTFGDLDPKKGHKQLYIITMMVYMQNHIPKTSRHVFNQEHTAKTRIRDAVLATASIPGMYPIVFLDKREESFWEKGEEYHHIPGGLDTIPLEEFFDTKAFISQLDEKNNNATRRVNLETLCLITHDDSASSAKWKPIPTSDSAKLLYALTMASKEELQINENSASPRRKYKRTVLLTIANPIMYAGKAERKLEAATAENSMRVHFRLNSMEPIEEEKKENSGTKSVRNKLSTLFSSNPSASSDSTKETPEIKPNDEPRKKRCMIM